MVLAFGWEVEDKEVLDCVVPPEAGAVGDGFGRLLGEY